MIIKKSKGGGSLANLPSKLDDLSSTLSTHIKGMEKTNSTKLSSYLYTCVININTTVTQK